MPDRQGRTNPTDPLIRNYGNDAHGRELERSMTDPIPYFRPGRVPRFFRAALGGFASLGSVHWPPDASSGEGMAVTPHARVIRVVPDRRSGLTTGGDALRRSSSARIPPVTVRVASR